MSFEPGLLRMKEEHEKQILGLPFFRRSTLDVGQMQQKCCVNLWGRKGDNKKMTATRIQA
jgi:hypothetical protein